MSDKYWQELLGECHPGHVRVIVDGCHYFAGNGYGSRWCGLGGQRHDIEMQDGRKFTTYDLWVQGAIPQSFRDRLPDNAKFVNCLNDSAKESNNETPPFPLPDGKEGPPWRPAPALVCAVIAEFARAALTPSAAAGEG